MKLKESIFLGWFDLYFSFCPALPTNINWVTLLQCTSFNISCCNVHIWQLKGPLSSKCLSPILTKCGCKRPLSIDHSAHLQTFDCKQVVIWPSTFLFIVLIMEYLFIHWDLTEFLLLKSTNSFILCATMCTMCMTSPLSVLMLTANTGNFISTDHNTDGIYKVINKQPFPGKPPPPFSKKSLPKRPWAIWRWTTVCPAWSFDEPGLKLCMLACSRICCNALYNNMSCVALFEKSGWFTLMNGNIWVSSWKSPSAVMFSGLGGGRGAEGQWVSWFTFS